MGVSEPTRPVPPRDAAARQLPGLPIRRLHREGHRAAVGGGAAAQHAAAQDPHVVAVSHVGPPLLNSLPTPDFQMVGLLGRELSPTQPPPCVCVMQGSHKQTLLTTGNAKCQGY